MNSIDTGLINNFYFSRFIDSLEQDYEQWTMMYCGGGDGWTWTEYHGPTYTNDNGEKLQFAFTLNSTGAYVNGTMSWSLGFADRFNIFSERTRRFKKATVKMKSYLNKKQNTEYNKKLMDAL
jgi:hypothetical protein